MTSSPHQRIRVSRATRCLGALSSLRGRLLVALAVAIAFVSVLASDFARPGQAQESPAAPSSKAKRLSFVPGEILVRFRTDAAPASSTSKLGMQSSVVVQAGDAQLGMQVERLSPGPEVVTGLRLARVAPVDTMRAIEALRKRADVIYAEPNYIRRKATAPNDPRYAQMWGLNNTGQPSTFGGNPGKAGSDIRAEQAWNVTTGSRNVVVGIVDEGIDINHEDLRDNIWTNPGEVAGNGLDDDANGLVDDIHGWDFVHNDAGVFDYTPPSYPPSQDYTGDVDDHGTHVAGTIGATGNNGIGVVGVNWQISLMSLKFLAGAEGQGSTADLLKALGYAKTMRDLWTTSGGTTGANLRVLNNSYGGDGFSQAELEAIRALAESGILFVVSAGNDGQSNDKLPTYPSSYTSANLISVAASTGGGQRAYFSNYGPASVHITAPGEYILSTTPRNTYNFYNGTSMAAPHVAGSAALVCAAYPDITMQKLRSLLLYTGFIATWQYNDEFPISTGRSVDVNSVLQNVSSVDATPPAQTGEISQINRSFPTYGMTWQAPGDDANTGKAAAYQVRFSDAELTGPDKFELATPLPGPNPVVAGNAQYLNVRLPWRHPSGFISVRAVDEVGNAGPITSTAVSVDPGLADPFIMEVGPPSPLSTGGTALGLKADDAFKQVFLPFSFKFFDYTQTIVQVSTNGALYFDIPPTDDHVSSVRLLHGYKLIAAAWDDLRTDLRAGDDVYVVTPDPDRIIFRWQGVTYNTPVGPGVSRGEHPVSFEIELQINGTAIIRYGDGNERLFPVVGMGAGWPEPYVVASHTSSDAFKNLTNAGTVKFTLRNPPPPPTAELSVTMRSGPNPVATGGEETYEIVVRNDGPHSATNLVLTDTLPAGLTFVSCTTNLGSCSGPSPGSGGTVMVRVNELTAQRDFLVTIVAQVTAAPGSTISNTVTASSSRLDTWSGNNSATATAQVVQVAPFGNVVQISSAETANFALKQDGTVWAWGETAVGESMGTGATGRHPSPMQVNNLSGVTSVSTGGRHHLALKSDGTVWGWGGNGSGQAGSSDYNVLEPKLINGLGNITAVSAGGSHSLALGSDGRVWAWGNNTVGQLGQGTIDYTPKPTPVLVPSLTGVVFIAAGSTFNVVVRNDGTVWTWGNNQQGQLGFAGLSTKSPAQVSGVSGVKAVSAGWNHVLALKNDGTVMGWGGNQFGQTGSPNYVDSVPTPTSIGGLSGVNVLAAGSSFSLALKSDGSVWGWGVYGGRGTGGSATPQSSPSQISEITNAVTISAGGGHSLALLNDGSLRSWGFNGNGQLGDGTYFSRSTPVQVSSVLLVAKPIISPENWTAYPPIAVTIACLTPGAAIHYTTNGQEPTESDPIVASGAAITITQSVTVKARAFRSGWIPSAIATSTYQVLVPPTPLMMQLSSATYTVLESAGSATVTVNRTGDISAPASIGYTTSDSASLVECNVVNGTASSRCDYATSIGTLYFAAGQASSTIYIPIVDDAYADGNENLTLTLSNPNGGNLGNPQTATVVIHDNDASSGVNPLDNVDYFIRQNYIDFLGREPDPAGLAGWRSVLNNCGTTVAPPCDRIEVSAGFFRSPEFQQRGYYIYRFYSVLGKIPLYDEFMPDLATVSGFLSDQQLETNKAAFAQRFTNRMEFANKYGVGYPPAYVDAMLQTVGMANHPSRAGWIAGLTNGSLTRAQVLRQLVESAEVYNKYNNEAFVIMQYFGYLRRTADASYLNWIQTMNTSGGDYRTMINGFMNSAEYRRRFGPQ